MASIKGADLLASAMITGTPTNKNSAATNASQLAIRLVAVVEVVASLLIRGDTAGSRRHLGSYFPRGNSNERRQRQAEPAAVEAVSRHVPQWPTKVTLASAK